MKFLVVAVVVAGCQTQSTGSASNESSTLNTSLDSDAVHVTLGADASLTVLVKATGYTWTSPAPANPYTVRLQPAPPNTIVAILTRGTESWNVTLALGDTNDGFEVTIAPTSGALHVELPGFPYPFTMPTDTGNYVQNTSSDGLLFKLSEASSIKNMYDFVAIPWWGLTDFKQAMMAILETPYMPAGDEPSVVLAPEKLKYVFVPHGSYVELARYYREYVFTQNPGMRNATLAASMKSGIANLKAGAYIYFWGDDAQNATFMTSLHDAGLHDVLALIYHGNTDLTDEQIGTLFSAVEPLGWTGGIYTLPGANLGKVAGGDWARTLTLGIDPPVEFWNGLDMTHQAGFDLTCVRQAMLGPDPITDDYVTLQSTTHNQLNYFDTFVVQVAPCLNANHVGHHRLSDTGPLPSSVDEERDYRVRFLDAVRAYSIVGSGEGLAPGWAIPHVDYFEGAMILGEYGEMHTMIPSGDYALDFATSIDPANVGYNTDETHRIPLFELMFHDHVASTWNWRNTNYQNTVTAPKKDLFNALYGTVPMYNMSTALWTDHATQFLASYQMTRGTRTRIGFSDMTGFGYLSDDREVQYTDWDGPGGTRVIANFSNRARVVGGLTIPALGYKLTTH
jgi:Glycosyl hydrolases related to GH101 family, GH129